MCGVVWCGGWAEKGGHGEREKGGEARGEICRGVDPQGRACAVSYSVGRENQTTDSDVMRCDALWCVIRQSRVNSDVRLPMRRSTTTTTTTSADVVCAGTPEGAGERARDGCPRT